MIIDILHRAIDSFFNVTVCDTGELFLYEKKTVAAQDSGY